jgi:hypothetical protein
VRATIYSSRKKSRRDSCRMRRGDVGKAPFD